MDAHLLRNDASDSLAELAILLERAIEQLAIRCDGGAVLLLLLLCLCTWGISRSVRLSALWQCRRAGDVPDDLLRLLSESNIL